MELEGGHFGLPKESEPLTDEELQSLIHELREFSDNKYKAVIFDYWKTLSHLDEEKYIPHEIQELLRELSEHTRLAIVSNSSKYSHAVWLRKHLKNLNLLHLFEVVVSSGAIDIHKPDERIFQYALNFLNCKPEKVLMLGDSPEDGACQALGIHFLKVNVDKKNVDRRFLERF